jgi:hypothetical protein
LFVGHVVSFIRDVVLFVRDVVPFIGDVVSFSFVGDVVSTLCLCSRQSAEDGLEALISQ